MTNISSALLSYFAALCCVLAVTIGCQDSPQRVAAPSWDAATLAADAIELLDTDRDGLLNIAELETAPGLAAGIKLIDLDQDGSIRAEEISARFDTYRRLAIGRCSRSFQFLYKGRPLVDAKVVFTPEPFLEGVIDPATAITNRQGIAFPHSESTDFPGMQVGYYRIHITSPQISLPAKYNESTELGVEISGSNDDASGYGTMEFRLDH